MSEYPVHRRSLLVGGAGLVASLAGCISTSATPPGQNEGSDESGGDSSESTELLKAGGSSTVYPIANKAGSYWNSNPPAEDEEYWGPTQYGIDTDENLADYWAGRYGFESDSGSSVPFTVSVGLSHSGTGLEKVRNEQLDIGNASAPVSAELPDASQEELDKFVNHVVGVDAQPIVVSKEIYDAGVTKLTADKIRAIYRGEITNWSEIDSYGGPDREIQTIGRSVGSGTDTAFRANLLGDSEAEMPGVDVRKGQNQQVKTTVSKSNNAIAYMALAFVDDSVPAISLEVGGKTYTRGENLSDPGYPLARDLHCYTYEDTSKREAAFLRMILSDFGQQTFVEPTGYAPLTQERRETELSKLPETV
ncbi:phosphate ABC transporter substrate-binding protein, phot family [Halogeometricum borinquense DSM 11551]|uniref:phosphate ABC transporter substrate-binding protein, PHOT family n=2 Tax=Halogeometricum borinquense TaxID=60847 RepID=E4NNX3_HALBP|nr:PstS family phosphate ABC transporter substrate-binding protein [Halogeometricum borinquense]ADQ66404.1 phosphate ABC transporter substrate-binding protein, PhoT family [Halogeometricum borinquense DSM 11551]ELY31124.1 phosphate ABC transporter substrate-binding protein, phot family [Halogeometricum borinquense DSM 11551]RYJ15195.1 PstS family phosphate ABC transporter substrate-binding protein [Halogeometricum borinquense]